MIRTDEGVLPRQATCTRSEFQDALEAIVDLEFLKVGRRASALGRLVSAHPYATDQELSRLLIPFEAQPLVAHAISGTPGPAIYEWVLSLLMDNESDRAPQLAHCFVSDPDPEGVRQVVDRLLAGYRDGRVRRIEKVILAWFKSGILNSSQESEAAELLVEKSEFTMSWLPLIAQLPAALSDPWLRHAVSSRTMEVSVYAMAALMKRGIDVPEDVLASVATNVAGAGMLVQMGFVSDDLLLRLNPELRYASTLAKCSMAWKFLCEGALTWEWSLHDNELEIEQLGMIDGQSVGTDGVIFVFRYRSPSQGYEDWCVGISGPYSVQEDPARHLGGLDYTQADIGLVEGSVEDVVASLLGVASMHGSLAVKPKKLD